MLGLELGEGSGNAAGDEEGEPMDLDLARPPGEIIQSGDHIASDTGALGIAQGATLDETGQLQETESIGRDDHTEDGSEELSQLESSEFETD